MKHGICRALSLTLAAGVIGGCGGERALESTRPGEATRGQLSKAAVVDANRAVVTAAVLQDEAPVSGANVEFSRSISGKAPVYRWSGTTDETGEATVEIAGSTSGYYQARASVNGAIIGHWSSIPINTGYRLTAVLSVGEKARIADVWKLTGLFGEIAVGLVPHLTGRLSSSIPPLKTAAEMAVEEINRSSLLGGARIRLIIEDSRSTLEGAAEAYNKLIHQDRVTAIIGPRTSTLVREVFPIAESNEVVAISPTSAARGLSAIGDFVFRASLSVDRLIPGGVRITREKLGYRRVATIYDNADVFSESGDVVFKEALAESGVEVLATETFQSGDEDFSAQLTRIKALNPDALFISAQATELTEIIIQGRQLGIPAEVHFIANLVLTANEIERAGPAAEGVISFTAWSSTSDAPGNRDFVRKYAAAYGTEPNTFAAQSYTAVYVLAQAIANAQSSESRAIRDALAEIRNLDTVMGTFSFDADGDAIYDAVVQIVRNGRLEVLDAGPKARAIARIGEANESGLNGVAAFTQVGDSVSLVVRLRNASQGEHAVHIHEKGDCSAPDGTSAGGHWNPTGVAHGKWGEGEFHLGDLGNVSANEQGMARLQMTTNLWEMNTGSAIDVVGKAIVVHTGPDDFTSQPSGNAGPRIGCGVIELER